MGDRVLLQRARAVEPGFTDAARRIVRNVLESPSQPLDPTTRDRMESRFGCDFGRVRVHADARAAESARAVGALAYTVGRDVVFGAGQYRPATTVGRGLMAHELTHVVQQSASSAGEGSAGVVASPSDTRLEAEADHLERAATSDRTQQSFVAAPITRANGAHLARKADPAALAGMKASEIQANPDYIDNNFARMTFYGAEEADITYADGAVLRLGLVPKWIKPPFVTVDYHTARAEFAAWNKSDTDMRFIPSVRTLTAPADLTYGQVLEKHSVAVAFAVEPASGKIVPNHVNPVTAPRLCAWLLATEAEYIKNFDAVAKGMIVILEKMKLIIELELMRVTLPSGGGAKKPPTLKPPVPGGVAFEASAVAEELVLAAKAAPSMGQKMLVAATRLSGMGGYSAAQKVEVILAFFKRIGFSISKEGVKETAEYFLMHSEDSKYAFKIVKATGNILYGKFDMMKLDYVWSLL